MLSINPIARAVVNTVRASPLPGGLMVSCYPASETLAQALTAVPVQCALTLAGSIESIVITVNVQV